MTAPFSTNRSSSPRRTARSAPAGALGRSSLSAVRAADRLNAIEVLSFLGTSIAPLAVIGGAISTGWAVTGVTGFPLAFIIVGAALALFTVGYVAVAQHLRNAGAFSAYISAGLGKPLGVAAAFVAVVAYAAMGLSIYGMIGPSLASFVADKVGIELSWWIWSLVVLAVVSTLAVLRVDLNGKVLGYALAAELLLVVVLDVINAAHPFQGHVSFHTWTPASLSGAGLGVALVIAMNGFVGFEGAAVFSEEAKEPARTVRRATFLALGVMTVVYAVSAWAMSVTIGVENVATAAKKEGPNLPFVTVAGVTGGNILIDLGQVLFISSLFASILAFHNTTSRYAFALGREHVLPSFLGRTWRRTNAPRSASLILSTIGLVVLLGYAASGADPIVKLFLWGTNTASFGILSLITVTSFAVIGYFIRNRQYQASVWESVIAPLLAGLLLAAAIWQILDAFKDSLGVEANDPLRWQLPSVFLGLAILGAVWALILRATRPNVYRQIGLGGQANAMTLQTNLPPQDDQPPTGHWTPAGR
jgi:amino acid transporter